ncbi:myrosinase 1-like [Phymastichus coffea]|uniref:myrosinase 1-like n=1 Tax=Phymastichus coffea TaxID=108790 RepID=UPI00273CECAA|nr:myrosinase 1-like [Phymastichus coffea]
MRRCGALLVIAAGIGTLASERELDLALPAEFLVGTASSAYQVEGAWNASGKAESVWDDFAHNHPGSIADGSNADTACDFYHRYARDAKMLKEIGLGHFRFSISWTRIFDGELATRPNPRGVRFYHDVLDELERQAILPIVTLYHWDHPRRLERLGGWTNSYMAQAFADYARFVFREFGSRVPVFVTINEPQIFCQSGYAAAEYAPAANLSDLGKYLCLQNALKAHALAYHIYDREFRGRYKGKVGIVAQCYYYYGKSEADSAASEVAFEFNCGSVANPIFSSEGDFPPIMKQRIRETSELRNLSRSLLPDLSPRWIELIRGSSDFFGLNHYTSHVVESLPRSEQLQWPNDEGLRHSFDPAWRTTESNWLRLVPRGFGDLLRKIKRKYGNPEVLVTECGASDADLLNDRLRIDYLYAYMREMLIAIKRDGCNVKAFTVWSFLDSFEWDKGFTNHFGLVNVDFSSANLTRTFKKSASWLKAVLQSRKLVDPADFP